MSDFAIEHILNKIDISSSSSPWVIMSDFANEHILTKLLYLLISLSDYGHGKLELLVLDEEGSKLEKRY